MFIIFSIYLLIKIQIVAPYKKRAGILRVRIFFSRFARLSGGFIVVKASCVGKSTEPADRFEDFTTVAVESTASKALDNRLTSADRLELADKRVLAARLRVVGVTNFCGGGAFSMFSFPVTG